MTSADCNTNGNCICPEPNSSPTVFMPESKVSLMMASGGLIVIASVRSSSRPLRSPSTMRRSSRSNNGSPVRSRARLLVSRPDTKAYDGLRRRTDSGSSPTAVTPLAVAVWVPCTVSEPSIAWG